MVDKTNASNRSVNEDIELWQKFRDGSLDAYTTLVERYSNILLNYGYRICQDTDFVKDCIQELFIEIWKRRQRYAPTSSVKSYLFKSLRRRILRDQTKWHRDEMLEGDYTFIVQFDIEYTLISNCHRQEIALKVKKILDHLPSRQKEILYLRFFEGLEFEAISQIMDINRQSVHNLLQKAYKSFKKEWIWSLLLVSSLLD